MKMTRGEEGRQRMGEIKLVRLDGRVMRREKTVLAPSLGVLFSFGVVPRCKQDLLEQLATNASMKSPW